ncbi:MAG: ABC transporter substrate-binding protein [Propionibacteriaceae bacterium]|jgi:branched-chain amino acid transport system substrate-binding protein|nr:ABC transporter substrate-binding protein [Propionibacteriaceae bacterium]
MKKKTLASLVIGLAFALSACAGQGDQTQTTDQAQDSPVTFGVIYPKTGSYAEYGRLFEQGLELAVEKVNTDGGIHGRDLKLKYFDTQSDPKQAAAVAPKLVVDPEIIVVLGDYSSSSSKAASPAFQQAGLVHYGFNNSATDFPSTGDHVWSPSFGTDSLMPVWADAIADTGAKTVSVIYIENDWGLQAYDYFADHIKTLGVEIVYTSAYPATPTDDYSPILIKARDAKADAIVQIGYAEGAQIVNTLRDTLGYKGPFYGGQRTPEFLDIAGKNAEGSILNGHFSNETTVPRVQEFLADFRAAYGVDPGDFNLSAYQAVIDLAYGINKTSPTREGVQEALQTVTDFPAYIGQADTFAFDQETRRLLDPKPGLVIVEDGEFKPYN